MEKPRKKIHITGQNRDERREKHGYNQACDDWEAWLKEFIPTEAQMKLENQVVCLDLALKMKELGFKQEGIFWWVITSTSDWHLSYGEPDDKWCKSNKGNFVVAPTCAELGEALKEYPQPEYCIDEKAWIFYPTFTIDILKANTETNARAKCWIYLKENGLLK